MSDFNKQVLIGVFVSPNWEDYGFEVGQIVEIGYHNSSEECVEPSDDDAEYLWCQTWGTWNPLMSDHLNEKHVRVVGKHLDWRSPNYQGIDSETQIEVEKIINSVDLVEIDLTKHD